MACRRREVRLITPNPCSHSHGTQNNGYLEGAHRRTMEGPLTWHRTSRMLTRHKA